MSFGTILRIFMCAMGGCMMILSVTYLARKKLSESFSLIWGLLAVIFIAMGIIIRPTMLRSYISPAGLALIIAAVFCVVGGLFFISVRASEVYRKNMELAIDVSLLHEECDELRKELYELEKEVKKEAKKQQS